MAQHRRQRKTSGFWNVAQALAQHKDDLFIGFIVLGFSLPFLYALLLTAQISHAKAKIEAGAALFILVVTWIQIWQRLQEHKARIAALYAQSQADLETSHKLALARLEAFSEGFQAGLEVGGRTSPVESESVDLETDCLDDQIP